MLTGESSCARGGGVFEALYLTKEPLSEGDPAFVDFYDYY